MDPVKSLLLRGMSITQCSKHVNNIARGVGLVLCSAATSTSGVEAPSAPGGGGGSGGRSPPSISSTPNSSSTLKKSSPHSIGPPPKFSSMGTAVLRTPAEEAAHRRANIRFQAVPSSRVGRAKNFGVLFFRLGWEKYKERFTWGIGSRSRSSTRSRAGVKHVIQSSDPVGTASSSPSSSFQTTSTPSSSRSREGKGSTMAATPPAADASFEAKPSGAPATIHSTSHNASKTTSSGPSSPPRQTFSNKSHERIVETLCRMRGAVLKLGQMLSIQDDATVPTHITSLFAKVRDQAFAMPPAQLRATLAKEFKHEDWKANFFLRMEEAPVAAASIGQVHWAELKEEYANGFPPSPPPLSSSPLFSAPEDRRGASTNSVGSSSREGGSTGGVNEGEEKENRLLEPNGHEKVAGNSHLTTTTTTSTVKKRNPSVEVAIKVQYPGVAQSINSDIKNLRTILNMGFLPPGMFVDQVLRELRVELLQECQYLVEAEKQIKYATLLQQHPTLSQFFYVPRVYRNLCTSQLLVTEYVRGIPIDHITNPALKIPLAFRSYAAEQLMTLTLTELFDWCFMQTDPNFSNFLFNAEDNTVYLLDFGAARTYPTSFVEDYLEVVAAAARQDREMILKKSIDLGFLTGREVKEMLDAHVQSVLLLGKPFRDRHNLYDFSLENIPAQVQKLVPTMIRLRLKPPPPPAYSLHRRLSGTILLCTRLRATVPCGRVFWEIYEKQRAVFAAARLASSTQS